MDEKTALTYAITKALAYQENGGKPTTPKAGKTGETKSIFQFTPDTWKKDAGDVLGDPNAPITADNETKVVTSKVSKWIDEGFTAKQIASMWNAGVGEPDAYTGKFSDGSPSKGMNKKYNQPFDVPTYANDVANYAKQFYAEDFKPKIQNAQTSNPTVPTTPQSTTPIAGSALVPKTPQTNGLVGGLLNSLGGLST